MNNKITTRKDEIRYTTDNPERMLGKFITENVYKTYTEEFIDDDNGNVVPIQRRQLLFEKGTHIGHDVLTSISFYMAEGSIKEITVSNQKRRAFMPENQRFFLYKACARIEAKKHNFLLYAKSVDNAFDILLDYIELNYNGPVYISEIKEAINTLVLIDNIEPEENSDEVTQECDELDNNLNGKKFYQMLVRIVSKTVDLGDEDECTCTFIVQAHTASRANKLIEKYLHDEQEADYLESLKHPDRKFVKKTFSSFIEESKIIPIGKFIPVDFSEAYR